MRTTLLDIAFYDEPIGETPLQVLEKHKGTWEHYSYLIDRYRIVVIKFCKFDATFLHQGIEFYFFTLPSIFKLPFFLKSLTTRFQPEYVLNHSFQFPMASLLLKAQMPKHTSQIIQHHGDRKSENRAKVIVQKLAYRGVSACFFTGTEQAEPFFEQGIISSRVKLFNCMEGSSSFQTQALQRNYEGQKKVLWVGRLIEGKDPICFLKALSLLRKQQVEIKAKMLYQTKELETELKVFIETEKLQDQVELIGAVPKHNMQEYYQWANYYISTSHQEGSGWALCEAMSMGVIPIVSSIPSHQFMIGNGQFGLSFPVGDAEELANLMQENFKEDSERWALKSRQGFDSQLSFEAIARTVSQALELL